MKKIDIIIGRKYRWRGEEVEVSEKAMLGSGIRIWIPLQDRYLWVSCHMIKPL